MLVNPAYRRNIYEGTMVQVGIDKRPWLGLACLAGSLLRDRHLVRVLDLDVVNSPQKALEDAISGFDPQVVGISFTTPLFQEMCAIGEMVKEKHPDVVIVGGGAHATALPEDTLRNSPLDAVVIGEGDFTLGELVSADNLSVVSGIAYKAGGDIIVTPRRGYISDLDTLPFPSWGVIDLQRYASRPPGSRKRRVGPLETSRGCPFSCPYCTKIVFGNRFRAKSANRVVDEIEYMLSLGFEEIHIVDDNFSSDLERAKDICDLIIKRGLKFPWKAFNGLRVDSTDQELFRMMHRAGCYEIHFGIESGNQGVLDGFHKGITLEQVTQAVDWASKEGIMTLGYFMLGLPGDTEETIKDTLSFAVKLKLDYAKISYTLPLPGTRLYQQMEESELLVSNVDWAKYNQSMAPREIYTHPTVGWEVQEKYYREFFRRFYLRPEYIFRRFLKGLKDRTLFWDAAALLKTNWRTYRRS